jgi:hypothetical protein
MRRDDLNVVSDLAMLANLLSCSAIVRDGYYGSN